MKQRAMTAIICMLLGLGGGFVGSQIAPRAGPQGVAGPGGQAGATGAQGLPGPPAQQLPRGVSVLMQLGGFCPNGTRNVGNYELPPGLLTSSFNNTFAVCEFK